MTPVVEMGSTLRRAPAAVAPLAPGSRQDLTAFIARHERDLRQWMMIQIDVAHFRYINALFGSSTGDQVIAALEQVLVKDPRFMWFRTNGDVWVGVGEARPSQVAVEQVEGLKRAVVSGVHAITQRNIRLDLSVGVVFGESLEALRSQAEAACRQARSYGLGYVVVGHGTDRIEHSPAIRALLAGTPLSDVVQLYHQRIAHRDGTSHYEVLSRCGGLSMGGVICAIERMGMARDYDAAILRMALEQIPVGAPIHAVNLSADTLGDQDAILEFIGLLGGRKNIALEITETAVMRDVGKARHAVELLRSSGVDVFLDDYGDGATSLTMLGMPFSYVKLGTELSGLGCPDDVLRAVLGLAKARDMPVVAEMVETQQQFQRLFSEGVFGFQGFLVHRPEPIHAANWASVGCTG